MRSPGLLIGLLLASIVACGETERPAPPAASAPSASAPSATEEASAPAATEPEAAAPEAPEAPPAAAPAGAPGDAAVAEAKQIFATRCMTCHGAQGAGDGPAAAALNPRPRNFQEAAWQQSVTDAHLEKIILYGGAAVGMSPAMPGNPDLTDKAEVVRALVAHVRGLAE
jgi:mono/diheme cytochrome c family protein